MKIVTADQMRQIEQRADEMGLPSEVLMDNAGLAVALQIKRWLGTLEGCSILFLIGPGNNGGDGLVAARHLHDWGARVHLYLLSRRSDSDTNYRLAQQRGIPCILATGDESLAALEGLLSSAKVVVDALFGTGKVRPLAGAFRQVLEKVRQVKEARDSMKVVALDLPSGLDADTGAVDPSTLFADLTVTLDCPKLGLFNFPGAERVGKIVTVGIGIPGGLTDDVLTELITDEWAKGTLPERPLQANKGAFGKVLTVAGSVNYVGAAYLACAAAMRVGAGLVTLATARRLQPILASKLTEVTYVPLPEGGEGMIGADALDSLQVWLPGYNVLLCGCGLGQNPEVVRFVRSLLFSPSLSPLALVLDADALNALAGVPRWWERLTQDAVLTPHPGEMSRLSGLPVEEIQRDRLEIARRMAYLWRKTVVLKGAHTVIAAPDGRARISGVSNPGLASAGTGDVLAGAIAGLLAQGLDLFNAAACGVYLHAEAGEIVRQRLGIAGMIASDLLPVLPVVIQGLKEGLYAAGY